ncbi:PIN domain-containing protein [Nocardioides speluncae]|uniref:PIN domain-containing protein n=1 Tax=Nocardioides speluncae TaxID=2670337 RepID=UPI000D69CB2E|nr:PIN domain-containing protein [Nocardioides speluncae]
MIALVLDSEAFSSLARSRSGSRSADVHAALRAAIHAGSDVLVPAAVLAEQYRGGRHDQVVDSCLSEHSGIEVVDTTRQLARRIGNLLARAGRGSRDHVDATVVAVAVAAGGAVIMTGDSDDIGVLAAGLVGITIYAI